MNLLRVTSHLEKIHTAKQSKNESHSGKYPQSYVLHT